MLTLHGYILRDLLKTFALSVTGLTVLFTMGGGLYNVIAREGVTAGDLARFLPLLVPVVITLTMPLSALFAATMVYGRLAADNELTACRAAGINIHRLFLSAVLLAVFVAAFTLLFGNYVIPDFMRQMTRLARANLRDIAAERLRLSGYIHYAPRGGSEQYFMTAEDVQNVSTSELARRGLDPQLQYLWVNAPAIVHLDRTGQVDRFTTARGGLCQFDTRGEHIELTIYVNQVRDFEIGRRAVAIEQQTIGPIRYPLPMPSRVSWQTLGTLLAWRRTPWEADKLGGEIDKYLLKSLSAAFGRACFDELHAGATVVLQDASARKFRISAKAAEAIGENRVRLDDARILADIPDAQRPTLYEAPRAEVTARAGAEREIIVELRLIRTANQPVRTYDATGGRKASPRDKPTTSIDDLRIPPDWLAQLQVQGRAAPFQPDYTPPPVPALQEEHARLVHETGRLRRQIDALIHFRLGTSLSVLVTVLMGAALGVIFRGGRALVAFGLGFIPFGLAAVLTVMGRQLGENQATQVVGPAVIWGGLAALLIADLVLIRAGVRR